MRLKSLELQGFKSFPDRTKLNFDTGMTVVIGPNGSGKSNIADAIRWVLGELSSKNIRGTKMEDVIFGGTDNRRPMGYAEVSLTFDNTRGEIPLPVEYDEVTVTRKYYRSGDSEYMINGQNVRLKDITELFMNTGLGRSGYSIIGQGRIAEIISKKSEDRRGIFEEAAGISKYRYKKSEAERKLEKTDDNLSRVTDILSELEGRVEPLRKDAEKARKYLDLFAEKKQVDVGLWLYEIDSIRTRSEKLQNDHEIAKHELEMAEDSLAGLDRQIELLYKRIHENKEKSEDARREALQLTEEKHAADADAMLAERDIQHAKGALSDKKGQILKMEEEGRQCAEKVEALSKEGALHKEQIARLNTGLEEAQREIDQARTSLFALSEQQETANGAVERSKEGLQEILRELSQLEGIKNGEKERKEELEKQMELLSSRMKATGEELLQKEKTLAQYKEKENAIKEKIRKIEEDIRQKTELAKQLSEKANRTAVSLNTTTERIHLLKRMEEHFEGYAGSVRYLMNEASKGRLTGICGPVSKLITVEEKYATAIEITLGASLQNIVTEDERSAQDAISELKRSGNGRATFYPLSTMTPQPLDIDRKKLAGMPGYVGIAAELVDFDKKYRSVMEYLLCRTVICQTLDNASAIGRAFGYKFKVVSLDGQVVNAGGSFTGGAVKKEGGILSRGAEIARLIRQKESLEKEFSSVSGEQQQLTEKIASLEQDKQTERDTLEIIGVMYSSEDTDYKVKKSKLDSDKSQLNALNEGLLALSQQMEGYNARKEALEARAEEATKEIGKKQAGAEELREHYRMWEEKRTAAIQMKDSLIMKKGNAEKDLAIVSKESERTVERMAELQREIAGTKEDLVTISEKIRQYTAKKAEQEALSEKLAKEISGVASKDSDLQAENQQFEQQTVALRQGQKEKTRHREIILKEYTRLDGALESIKTEQDRFSAKLWDEYELTYAASKELDYPEITEATKAEATTKQNRLRSKIRELGPVNVGAIEEYADVKERYDFLSGQYKDLTAARNELSGIITGLEKEMKQQFADVFSAINNNFRVVFSELFGGGTAELSLSDPENILESGIEISVAPPGKIIKNLSLLSGGEQVFVAIALFFAILQVTPAPFCLLDEIEAALDEVNVQKFARYARNYSEKTQFIIISHRRGTMEEADTMYGVTMGERGISRVLPLHLNEVEGKTGLKI